MSARDSKANAAGSAAAAAPAAQPKLSLSPPQGSELPASVNLLTWKQMKKKYSDRMMPLLVIVRPVQTGEEMAMIKQVVEAKLGEQFMHMGICDRATPEGPRVYHFNDPIGNATGGDKKDAKFVSTDLKSFLGGYKGQPLFADLELLHMDSNQKLVYKALARARNLVDKKTSEPYGVGYNAATWNCQHVVFGILGGQYAECAGQAGPAVLLALETAVKVTVKAGEVIARTIEEYPEESALVALMAGLTVLTYHALKD